jgi:hypothetical protein
MAATLRNSPRKPQKQQESYQIQKTLTLKMKVSRLKKKSYAD